MKIFSFQQRAFINIKIIIILITSILFSLLFTINPAGTGLLSVILCLALFTWIIAPYIDEKIIIIFLFLFHLLPTLAGIQIAPAIPVFKPQRIAILFMLFYLFRKGYLLDYYSKFLKSGIFTRQIIFVLASLILSSILSDNKSGTFFYTISFFIEYIFMAVLVFSCFKQNSEIDFLVMLICLSTILLCVFGIFERITQFNFYHLFGVFITDFELGHQIRDGAIRISGPFNHSISFGVYLAMTIPFFLFKFKKQPLLLSASLVLILITILFTQSRAAMICTGITFILYAFFINRKALLLCLIISIPFILIISGYLITHSSSIITQVSNSSEQAESSMARLNQLMFLWNLIKENIIFGYGQLPPPAMVYRFDINPSSIIRFNSIDNFYLLYTYYYGIIGLLSWLFLIITILIKLLQYIKQNPLLPYLAISIILFSTANCVAALFDYHFLFWIITGIITRVIYNIQNDNSSLLSS